MTKSRSERYYDLCSRCPDLRNFLACYLYESWSVEHESVEAAILFAVSHYDRTENNLALKRVAHDLWAWRRTEACQLEFHRDAKAAFGIYVSHNSDDEFLNFMDWVYDRILEAIRQSDIYWRPGKGPKP